MPGHDCLVPIARSLFPFLLCLGLSASAQENLPTPETTPAGSSSNGSKTTAHPPTIQADSTRSGQGGASVVMPRVLTQAEAEAYHRLPGDKDLSVESYSPPIDWRTVPPWKQASFFGVRARGQLFVFVVDCSGSMADNLRLYRAKQELRRCIAQLRHPQQYQIIFYNDRPLPMPGGIPLSASNKAQGRIASWLESIDSEGGTDPKAAMNLAFSVRPDAIFLLSDGEFPEGTDSAISAQNSRRVPIHCIDLSAGAAGQQLRRIASDSGGQYAARP